MVRPAWVRQSRRYLPSWRLGSVDDALSVDRRSEAPDALAELVDPFNDASELADDLAELADAPAELADTARSVLRSDPHPKGSPGRPTSPVPRHFAWAEGSFVHYGESSPPGWISCWEFASNLWISTKDAA